MTQSPLLFYFPAALIRELAALLHRSSTGGTRNLLVALFLIMGLTPPVYSQILPFHYYTTKEGLPSNRINVMFQDSRGYMWIGTSNGISMFDGISFTNYSAADGLRNNYISTIVESGTHPGVLYVSGATGGVCRYENGKFGEIKTGRADSSANIEDIALDENGDVWFLTPGGLYSIRDSVPVLQLERSVAGKNSNLIRFCGGALWFAQDDSLFIYENLNENHLSRVRKIVLGSVIMSMTPDRDGTVWIGTADSTLYEFQNFQIIRRRKLAAGAANSIVDDGNGTLWVASANDFLKLPKNDIATEPITLFSTENALVDLRNGYPFFDRENNLWIGSWAKGITVLPERNVYHIVNDPDRPNQMAVADSSGHLWVASRAGVWELFPGKGGAWQKHLHHLTADANKEIYFLYCDAEGNLWVNMNARPGEIRCYAIRNRPLRESEIVLRRIVVPDSISDDTHLHAVLIDREGRLWASAFPAGVIVRDAHSLRLLRVFSVNDGLPDNSVLRLFEDSKGNIWLGGFYGGLAVKSAEQDLHGRLRSFTLADGLPDNGIRSFCEDRRGRLWIGTRYGGAALYDSGRFRSLASTEVLQNKAIWSIAEDVRGRMWFGTEVGLECISETTMLHIRTSDEFFGNRVVSGGIYHNRFLWLATLAGVSIDDFSRDLSDTVVPPVVIRKFEVNGSEMQVSGPHELSYEQNLCTIEFAGLSYKDPRGVRYQYKLDDVDRDWLLPTPHHVVTYATLQPGTYTFQVRAIKSGGLISRAPAVLRFTISPPFWQRWWFYSLMVCLFAGVLFALYRYRINKLLEVEHLRVRIASDLHDDVGSTLTRIAVHSEVIQTTDQQGKIVASSKAIGAMSREIISTLSDIVWSIDARHDSLGDLVDRIRAFSIDILSAKDIHVVCETEDLNLTQQIPVDLRQTIYLIAKEAVNNAAKYSEAQNVALRFTQEQKTLTLTIMDDGVGLPAQPRSSGHGLANMKLRAERIGAALSVVTQNGLTVKLTVKM